MLAMDIQTEALANVCMYVAKRRPSFIPSTYTEVYNGTSDMEASSFSLYGVTTVYIQRQQHGITRHDVGQGFCSRNIELAQNLAYIRSAMLL